MSDSLTGFYLKLKAEDHKELKLLCIELDLNNQYQLLDKAVAWALDNNESIDPIASSKSGTYRTYYLKASVKKLEVLEKAWDCNPTRALHTAIVKYLSNMQARIE